MKKIFILPVLFCLCACDNNTVVGKCLPQEKNITTIEQNGKTIQTSTTVSFLCGCFDDAESDTPQIMLSKEAFSFETTDTITLNEIEESVEYIERKTPDTITDADNATPECNKDCTKHCKTLGQLGASIHNNKNQINLPWSIF